MAKPTVATLAKDIEYIKQKVDDFTINVMPKSEVLLRIAEVNKDIADLKVKITEVEIEAKKKDWKSHTLTSVLTAVGVLAITYIFNDIVGK